MIISVALVINENFKDTNLIEDALNVSGTACELLVFNNGCRDINLINSLKERANLFLEGGIIVSTFGTCLNELIVKASGEYIFVFNKFGYFQDNWLRDLAFFHDQIQNIGCVGISILPKVTDYAISVDDELVFCYYPEESEITGNILFSNDKLIEIGGFDLGLNSNQCITEFAFRLKQSTFINLFTPNLSYIELCEYEDLFTIDYKLFKNTIKKLLTSKNLWKPLFVQSEENKNLVSVLQNTFKDKVVKYSERTNQISYLDSVINYETLEKLFKLSKQYQFTFQLKALSGTKTNVFLNRIAIYINK